MKGSRPRRPGVRQGGSRERFLGARSAGLCRTAGDMGKPVDPPHRLSARRRAGITNPRVRGEILAGRKHREEPAILFSIQGGESNKSTGPVTDTLLQPDSVRAQCSRDVEEFAAQPDSGRSFPQP
jgi:hypothetical protein